MPPITQGRNASSTGSMWASARPTTQAEDGAGEPEAEVEAEPLGAASVGTIDSEELRPGVAFADADALADDPADEPADELAAGEGVAVGLALCVAVGPALLHAAATSARPARVSASDFDRVRRNIRRPRLGERLERAA